MSSIEVAKFNSLPRQKMAPSGMVANDWVFDVFHVDLSPPGDLLMLVNPGSRYVHMEGPDGGLSKADMSEKAQSTAKLLIKAFNGGMGMDDPDIPPRAPLTWSTSNSAFAKAVGGSLADMGVKAELQNISVAGKEDMAILSEAWSDLYKQVRAMVGAQ